MNQSKHPQGLIFSTEVEIGDDILFTEELTKYPNVYCTFVGTTPNHHSEFKVFSDKLSDLLNWLIFSYCEGDVKQATWWLDDNFTIE